MDFDDEFHFEKDGPVRRITFNRPEKHNALTVSMQKQLHEAVRAVRFDEEARVLSFTGAGNTFCAGDDIVEFPVLANRKLAYDSATALPEPASNPAANGFVVFSMFQETAAMIERCHPWVGEPIAEWLAEQWGPDSVRRYSYEVRGTARADFEVTRTDRNGAVRD